MGDAGIISVFERGTKEEQLVVDGIPMLIVWAEILIIIGHIILTKAPFGNWIFASGGDAESARNSGLQERITVC